MIKPTFASFFLTLSLGSFGVLAPHAGASAKPDATPTKPNIVVILADDLGFGDVHYQNQKHSKIPTPNIDQLASQGMAFTDAHSGSSLCSPTRYGLLTGRYAWRTRLRTAVLWAYDEPLIKKETLTLPAMLKAQGYTTACIGKWHLGWNWPFVSPAAKKKCDGWDGQYHSTPTDLDWTKPMTGGPVDRGFDHYFGTPVPNMPPYGFVENRHYVTVPTAMVNIKALPKTHCISIPGPMVPGWRFDEILPTLAEKTTAYIDARAAEKKPFFLYFALTSPHEPVAPSKKWLGKSGINPIADFIMETDDAVGAVLRALKKNGLDDNTLVIFTSDNGHGVYAGDIKGLIKHGHYPSGPFRGYKADIFEGGHRVPFIARWPGKIKVGSTCDDTICLTDLMATSAEIVGAKLPTDAGVDSESILPDLLGTAKAPRSPVVHQSSDGSLSIRQGKWKLNFCPGSGGWSTQPSNALARKKHMPAVQLYDMDQDKEEKHNLVAKHPDITAQLRLLLQQYIDQGRSTPGAKQKNDVLVKINL